MREVEDAFRALRGLIGGTADILLADYRMRLLKGEVLLQPLLQRKDPKNRHRGSYWAFLHPQKTTRTCLFFSGIFTRIPSS